MTQEREAVTRAEWTAVVAVVLNVCTIAFAVGVVWQQQQEHDRRIAIVETQTGQMTLKIERIDANVTFLAERAREDREQRR